MKEIPLTQGQVAIVDDADYSAISQYKWCAWFCKSTNSYYAVKRHGGGTRGKVIQMQRFLLNNPPGMLVDHRNHNTLDNRRENLRVCTSAQNQRNKVKRRGVTSCRYKGVHPNGKHGFMAQCGPAGTHRYLGTFRSEEEAAIAYNKAAVERFGEFAYLNNLEAE